MKNLLAIVLFILPSGFLSAQPFTSYLDTTYNLDGRSDWFFGLCEIDGKYYTSTWSNANGIADYGVARLDADGTLDNLHIYHDTATYENAIDLVRISNHKLAMAVQYRSVSKNKNDFKLVIVDNNFNLLSADFSGFAHLDELPQAITYHDGKIVLVGGRKEVDTLNIYLAAWDTSGNFLWDHEIKNPTNLETSFGITPTTDNGFMLAGARSLGNGRYDWLVVKTDSLGNQEWEKTFGGGGDSKALSVLRRKDGTYLITGYRQVDLHLPGRHFDGQLICLTEQGQVVWDSLYSHEEFKNVLLRKSIVSKDGGFVSIGTLEDDNTATDYGWIHKTDSLGKEVWSRKIIHQADDHQYLRDIEQTPDGGYLLVGSVFNQPNDAWVVKVDSMGCMVAGCDTIRTGISSVPVPEDIYMGDPVPNPTTGAITISYQLPPGTSGQMQVVDIHGRLLQTHAVHASENQLELDFSGLPALPGGGPAGLVFVSLQIGDRQPVTRAVMVE